MLLLKRLYFAFITMIIVVLIYLGSRKFPQNNKQFLKVEFSKKENFDRNVSRCQQLKLPNKTSDKIWQPVGYQTDIHVYSAFVRGSKIRIVGSKLLKRKHVVFCQVWYGGIESVLSVVKADMIDIPDHNGFKHLLIDQDNVVLCPSQEYATTLPKAGRNVYLCSELSTMCSEGFRIVRLTVFNFSSENSDVRYGTLTEYTSYMFDCAVQNSSVPFAVSLVPEPCVEPINILKVIDDNSKRLRNFTICLQPFFFIYDQWHTEYKIIEFIELSNILGAEKFVFYICNTTTKIDRVLMHYHRKKYIDILPWKLPKNVFSNIHVKGQLAAENDCLYRYGKYSKYLVYVDLDEFIIPRHHLSWNDMMDHLPQGFGEYNFRNVFFRTNWPKSNINYTRKDVALKYRVQSLLTLSRDKTAFSFKKRSKCIINPRLVDMVGIHFVWKFKNITSTRYNVNESEALLHHYRYWEGSIEKTPHMVDKEIFKYKDSFLKNVNRVWNILDKKS